MHKHSRDLPFVTAYMDYLLIYSANVELHVKHLQEDFCCLQKAGLHYEDTNVALVNMKCNILDTHFRPANACN